MTNPRKTTALRKDMLLAGMFILAGATLMTVSLMELNSERQYAFSEVQAQAQSPPARDAAPAAQPDRGVAPATGNPDSKDNARPHDVAPQPARPAQKSGAEPALPPAPAEKTAPPIKKR